MPYVCLCDRLWLSQNSTSSHNHEKTIILALALAAPAMAGDAKSAPITVVDVPPVVAPAPSPWALEIAGVHTWTMADADDRMHNINTWGVDVTGVYDLTPNWAATVRVGWATGSDDYVNPTEEIEVENWTITVGLRYSAPITESLSWYAGGEIGLAYTTYEDTVDWGPNEVFTEDFEGWG